MPRVDLTRNRPKDTKAVVDITQKYIKAGERIQGVIFSPKAKSVQQHIRNIDAVLEKEKTGLVKANRAFCTKELNSAFEGGRAKIDNEVSGGSVPIAPRIRTSEVTKSSFQDVKRSAFLDLNSAVTYSIAHLQGEIKSTFRSLDTGNRNLSAFQSALQKQLEGRSILEVEYKNGNRMGVEHYAKMLARSSRIETANLGQFGRAQELGSDLVECTIVAPTCGICAKYQGRVYSISGNDKRFVHLFTTALHRGYALIHPNCRHEFLPFFEVFYTKEEIEGKVKASNAPFKDTRGEAERKAFAKWQAQNRRNLRERYEYAEMKERLGDKMPYKTLAGFRRASRAHTDKWHKDRDIAADTHLAEARAAVRLDKVYQSVYNDTGKQIKVKEQFYNIDSKSHRRHMKELGLSEKEYIAKAKGLLEIEVDGKEILGFTTEQGTAFRYDVENNQFAIARPDGLISTFYEPTDEKQYFIRQIKEHARKK